MTDDGAGGMPALPEEAVLVSDLRDGGVAAPAVAEDGFGAGAGPGMRDADGAAPGGTEDGI